MYFSGKGIFSDVDKKHEAPRVLLGNDEKPISLELLIKEHIKNSRILILQDIWLPLDPSLDPTDKLKEELQWQISQEDKTYTLTAIAHNIKDKMYLKCPYKPSGSYSTDLLLTTLKVLGKMDREVAT